MILCETFKISQHTLPALGGGVPSFADPSCVVALTSIAVIFAVTAAAATAAAVGMELGQAGITAASGGVTHWNKIFWISKRCVLFVFVVLKLEIVLV